MHSTLFTRLAIVGLIAGLFYVGTGLRQSSDGALPGLSSTAVAADVDAAKAKAGKPLLAWQPTAHDGRGEELERAKILGGWLVKVTKSGAGAADAKVALTFVPDATHAWDGGSIR